MVSVSVRKGCYVDKEPMVLPQKDQVFQRDDNGVASIPFESERPVSVRLMRGGKTVKPWHEAENVVRDVPVGGPYRLDVECASGKRLSVGGLYVGDLWVLAGQSNMDGCGKLEDLEPPSSKVHCFYYKETWGIARDPLCTPFDSIDPVHWPFGEEEMRRIREQDRKFRETGAGLGIRFGKEIMKATGAPIGLITCSHGGTCIEQWDPALKAKGGHSLYGSMLRRVNACGGNVKGILWYQGESDANDNAAPSYKDRMKALIAAIRNDLDTPHLPFIQVQIARFFVDETQFSSRAWNLIQQTQLDLEEEMDNVATVAAIDGVLSDVVHLNALSLRRMGARLAELALVLAYGKSAPRAIRPGHIACTNVSRTEVEIRYNNVRGRLAPAANVRGFWVENATGERICITNAEIRGNTVRLHLEKPLEQDARIWYGRGCNPTTTLHDKLFAAPAFGPVTI